MAQISLNISSSDGSSFVIHYYKPAGLISIRIDTNLPSGTPYALDWVTIHGTDADLREFARRISAAFPPEPQAREETDEREESAREDAEQYETGAMRCPPRE